MTSEKPKRSFPTIAVVAVILVLVSATLLIGRRVFWRGNDQGPPPMAGGDGALGERAPDSTSDRSGEMLTLTRTAIASTENLDNETAAAQWTEVLKMRPDDASAARNLALSQILVLDEMTKLVTNPGTDADEVAAVRRKLPAVISAARDAINRYETLSGDAVIATWGRSRIDLHEAALLPAVMGKSIRREVLTRLTAAIEGPIGKDPRSVILGSMFFDIIEQLTDPIDGLPQSLRASATEAVTKLSDAHPDNLYFALDAARIAIESRSKSAAPIVRRSSELVTAIKSSIARNTRAVGKTPDELVDKIVSDIEAEDFDAAGGSMASWFNVLNGTELVKTDRKRGGPHPLDLLSMDGMRQLSAEILGNTAQKRGQIPLEFSPSLEIAQPAIAVAGVDANLDGRTDIAMINGDGELVIQTNGDTWSDPITIRLPPVPADASPAWTGLIAADLFVVDSSYRKRSSGAAAAQHNTYMHLIAYGPAGISVVEIDGSNTDGPDDAGPLLSLIDAETGLEDAGVVTTLIAGDFESDGDLDLLASTETGLRMYINRGNRTFFEIPISDDEFTGDPPTGFAIGDVDRDLDLDIVTVHAGSGKTGRLENLLHLQFRCEYLPAIPVVSEAGYVAIEDIDGDMAWDLIVGGSSELFAVTGVNEQTGTWSVGQIFKQPGDFRNCVVADFDNDSHFEIRSLTAPQTDFFALGPWGIDARTSSGVSPGKKSDRTDPNNDDGDAARGRRIGFVADFNQDGKPDLGLGGERFNLLQNQTTGGDHYVDVRFKGIDDNVSGRVNHYAIGSVIEARFGPQYRARIVTSPITHFGIDGSLAADIRAILPNGLTQVSRDVSADKTIVEVQELKGSCPYLYAFDGDKMQFVTDCLWAAPLGLQVARDVVAGDRPWEYLKVDGDFVKPRRNTDSAAATGDQRQYYDLRITEELWEIAYLDHVSLVAVDHPPGTQVWTNEKVGPESIATPTIFCFDENQMLPPQSALDTAGGDVTETLRAADEHYVKGFERRYRQGLCPPHHIDLQFSSDRLLADAAEKKGSPSTAFLVLTGWILPTDTSLNIQIDQNPDLAGQQFPSLSIPESTGSDRWRVAIPFIGFPGGKTKTIVVDVSKHLNLDDPRFRIETSAEIYWDSAALVVQQQPAATRVQDADLISAAVAKHGYSAQLKPDQGPIVYDYAVATQHDRWPPLAGPRTDLGDCLNLLSEWDDQMVVIASGDEVRLRFAVPPEDPPAGWKRDFVLHNVGWDKDADLNTLAGQSTLPLPYRNMSSYPPPADESPQAKLQYERNRSHLNRGQRFRDFWYRGASR